MLVSAIHSSAKSSLPDPFFGISGSIHRISAVAIGSPRTFSRRLFVLISYHPVPAMRLPGRTTRALGHHTDSLVNENFPASDSIATAGGLHGSAIMLANATSARRVLYAGSSKRSNG